MVNVGDSCYLNSAIQCLRAIPELQEILNNYDNLPQQMKNENNQQRIIRTIITRIMNKKNHRIFNDGVELVNQLNYLTEGFFVMGEQDDSHSALSTIIEETFPDEAKHLFYFTSTRKNICPICHQVYENHLFILSFRSISRLITWENYGLLLMTMNITSIFKNYKKRNFRNNKEKSTKISWDITATKMNANKKL